MSSKSKSRTSTGSTPKSSATKRKSASVGHNGTENIDSNLIVTRGLQEILEQDMARNHASASGTNGSGSALKRSGAGSTGPNFVVCYLCGRQFGSASIGIHRPQCYLKKMIEWERGNPALRGPRPIDPDTHEKQIAARLASGGGDVAVGGAKGGKCGRGGKGGKQTEMDAYNAAQFEAFNTQALSSCPNCGRTFLPDRLQVHLRSCKPGATARPVHKGPLAAATTAAVHVDPATNSPSASQPRAGGGGPEDRPIRAAGSYAVPEEAGADSVPTAATATATATGTGSLNASRAGSLSASGSRKEKGVSHRPGGAHRARPASAAVVTALESGDDDDAEIIVIEEEEREEALPIRPAEVRAQALEASSPAPVAAASLHASTAGEADGTATPRRHASMEPAKAEGGRTLEFHNYIAAERAQESGKGDSERRNSALVSGSPEHSVTEAAAALQVTRGEEKSSTSNVHSHDNNSGSVGRRSGGLPSAEERRRLRESSNAQKANAPVLVEEPVVAAHVVRATSSGASEEGEVGEEGEEGEGVKRTIQLNNVSRFKNVPSRLKVERQQAEVNLTPCKFCGRTFDPARIGKHESVCLERNKAPAPPVNRTAARKSMGSAGTAAKPKPKIAAAAPTASAGSLGAINGFCTSCGISFTSPSEKFCGSCGSKRG